MKNIEIITTQNVVLQYELAGLRDRAMAFLIDIIFLIIALSILVAIGSGIFYAYENGKAIIGTAVSSIFVFYSLAFETWNKGQSIGKMAMRIQVIKLAGDHITFFDYVARWVFRLIDIYLSLGGIASILVVSSLKAQRIGDIVANTAVVKIVPKMDLNLEDLLAIHQQSKYTPQYLQARKLQEEDALLIKSALDRYRKFKNEAHEEALSLLAQKVKQLLNIENVEGDHKRFLQIVLQDYIILSR